MPRSHSVRPTPWATPPVPAGAAAPRRAEPGRRPAGPAALPLLAALLLVLALFLALAAPAAAGQRFRDGDMVEVTGLVTDADGRPLPGVRVVLEAARSQFDIRSFRRVKKDSTRLTALTGDDGSYRLSWPWNGYYNVYELLVGVPVRKPKGDQLHVLERIDLSRRLKPDAPAVATVVVEDAEFVRTLRAFVDSIDSDDEQRVYREQGKPDRVENKTGAVDEAAWWYFERGRVYRFRDGRLVATESFDPVEEF